MKFIITFVLVALLAYTGHTLADVNGANNVKPDTGASQSPKSADKEEVKLEVSSVVPPVTVPPTVVSKQSKNGSAMISFNAYTFLMCNAVLVVLKGMISYK